MTSPDKPEDTEADRPAERTTVIAAGKVVPADAPDDEPTATTTPPPWQRVATDQQKTGQQSGHQQSGQQQAAEPKPDAEATQNLVQNPAQSAAQNGGSPAWPTGSADDATVTVARPAVSGTAAPRLFGGDSHDSAPRTGGLGTGALGGLGASGGPPSALRRPGRGPRRANLQVKRFDPWSVLKLSLVLGVALFFVWLVAVGALYAVLDGMGVWDKLNGISSELLNANTAAGGEPLISAGRVFGIAAIIGAINIVLFSALATVGAFVYNVSADLAGGLEVTLAERE
ncbi:DUF3566 domain-containing protein [Actinokineospora sp. 24-640]